MSGGPCSYNKTIHAAEVIGIYPTGSNSSEIELLVKFHEVVDTLSYYIENGSYVSNFELQEKSIKIGDKLIYEEHQISTGSCNPEIYILKLEKLD